MKCPGSDAFVLPMFSTSKSTGFRAVDALVFFFFEGMDALVECRAKR
jgi:hypothetical protein